MRTVAGPVGGEVGVLEATGQGAGEETDTDVHSPGSREDATDRQTDTPPCVPSCGCYSWGRGTEEPAKCLSAPKTGEAGVCFCGRGQGGEASEGPQDTSR